MSSSLVMCMKPCVPSVNDVHSHKCDIVCEPQEKECSQSCEFLHYSHRYKSGECPSAASARDFEAVCQTSCREDSDCEDDLQCCPNMCGHVCRQPDYTKYNLPPVPIDVTWEERRQNRSLRVSWQVPQSNRSFHGVSLFVLEQRNCTTQKPSWNSNTQWGILSILHSSHYMIDQVHAGHWYQFRVAMVTAMGSQGYSTSSKPFLSSRSVQRPLPPQNITEGVTTLRQGYVEVTIHWQPPKYSDLTIWRYVLTYSERLQHASPVLVKLTVIEKTLPGSVHEFKLKKLKRGTPYHIEIQAVMRHGNREFISKKASKYITTYKPPTAKPDTNEQVISVYKDIIRVEDLSIVDDMPYFNRGSLKATLTWSVEKDFKNLVKSFMIYWSPKSCDQKFAVQRPYSATSDVPKFEIYDLQYECQYYIRVNAVTRSGVQGQPSEVKLRTPVCGKILVKANSLHPDCPERVPQVPRSPRRVIPKTIPSLDNCTVDLRISWKHPRSDLDILEYLLTYEVNKGFQELRLHTQGTVYKPKPIEIRLNKVRRYTLRNLMQSQVYVIHLYAISQAGLGQPAYLEILTPKLFHCGAKKIKVPPDRVPSKTTLLPSVFITPVIIPKDSSDGSYFTIETVTKKSNDVITLNRTTQYSTSKTIVPNLNVYKTVYYMFIFFANLFHSH